jgi:hypothetical protein
MLGLATISKMGSGWHSLAADIFRIVVYIHLLKMLPLHLAAQILRNYLFVENLTLLKALENGGFICFCG